MVWSPQVGLTPSAEVTEKVPPCSSLYVNSFFKRVVRREPSRMADQVRKERVGISAWSRRRPSSRPSAFLDFGGNGEGGHLRWVPFLMAAAVLLLRGKPRFAKRLKSVYE